MPTRSRSRLAAVPWPLSLREVPFKPYLEELRTPSGINILRDSPFDHKHHHSLMFAVAVDGVNFWEEKEGCGRQEHVAISGTFVGQFGGTACAAFTESSPGRAGTCGLLDETRTIRLLRDPAGKASLVSWTAEFRPPAGPPRRSESGFPTVTFGGEQVLRAGHAVRDLNGQERSVHQRRRG